MTKRIKTTIAIAVVVIAAVVGLSSLFTGGGMISYVSFNEARAAGGDVQVILAQTAPVEGVVFAHNVGLHGRAVTISAVTTLDIADVLGVRISPLVETELNVGAVVTLDRHGQTDGGRGATRGVVRLTGDRFQVGITDNSRGGVTAAVSRDAAAIPAKISLFFMTIPPK